MVSKKTKKLFIFQGHITAVWLSVSEDTRMMTIWQPDDDQMTTEWRQDDNRMAKILLLKYGLGH